MTSWRASEVSETLSGLNNGNRIYIYICIYLYVTACVGVKSGKNFTGIRLVKWQ